MPDGHVTAIDAVPDIVAKAAADVPRDNLTFTTGDVYALDYPDATFDVVHAHQVLQHLTDPVAALREMRRVAKPGGLIAARDGDYGAMVWYPDLPVLTQWRELKSFFATQALDGGHATREDLERIADGWLEWAAEEDGWFTILNGEILCRA